MSNMRKITTVIGICLLMTLAACSPTSDMESLGKNFSASSGADDAEMTESETEETATELTAEVILQLSQKYDELAFEDLAVYLNMGTSFGSLKSVAKDVSFSYEGRSYILRVHALNPGVKSGPAQLQWALLMPTDGLTPIGDIRTGNAENILNGTAGIEDYLTLELPEGFQMGPFINEKGSCGGVNLYNEEGVTVGNITIWADKAEEFQMDAVKEYESVRLGDVNVRRCLLESEDGKEGYYLAATDKENAVICYCLYLDMDYISEEKFLEMSETMQLKDHAIFCWND